MMSAPNRSPLGPPAASFFEAKLTCSWSATIFSSSNPNSVKEPWNLDVVTQEWTRRLSTVSPSDPSTFTPAARTGAKQEAERGFGFNLDLLQTCSLWSKADCLTRFGPHPNCRDTVFRLWGWGEKKHQSSRCNRLAEYLSCMDVPCQKCTDNSHDFDLLSNTQL